MMKKIIIAVLLLLLVIVIGCGQEETAEELVEEEETFPALENDSTERRAEDEIDTPVPVPPGACTPVWKCISSQMKAYQNESCDSSEG